MNKICIASVHGRQVLDSRGVPTVEADLVLSNGVLGRATVPSGASCGSYEVLEIRDGDYGNYLGKSVHLACQNINREINNTLSGRRFRHQRELDYALNDLDGTKNKSNLGGNAILAVSMAYSRAMSNTLGIPLYQYIGGISKRKLPIPLMNILNGGKHAQNNLAIQEYMIIPNGANSFSDALHMGYIIIHSLKNVLLERGLNVGLGDEGGFSPSLKNNEEAFDLIIEAIESTPYKVSSEVTLAIDVAASELYDNGVYKLSTNSEPLSSEQMVKWYQKLCKKYPIISIEDGLDESDWSGWKHLTETLGKEIQLVGDDLFATNSSRLITGIEDNVANSILIKLNQIGTVSECIETVRIAKDNGYIPIISHRSGETEDTFIADFCVGLGCNQIKTGSLARTDRIAKYNQLLRIEESFDSYSHYDLIT